MEHGPVEAVPEGEEEGIAAVVEAFCPVDLPVVDELCTTGLLPVVTGVAGIVERPVVIGGIERPVVTGVAGIVERPVVAGGIERPVVIVGGVDTDEPAT